MNDIRVGEKYLCYEGSLGLAVPILVEVTKLDNQYHRERLTIKLLISLTNASLSNEWLSKSNFWSYKHNIMPLTFFNVLNDPRIKNEKFLRDYFIQLIS